MIAARENTAFALDAIFVAAHYAAMDSAQQIREALKAKLDAKQITQRQIGEVIGIAQPNVQTLFTPGKNGKLRDISFDEGKDLIRQFSLTDARSPISEDMLARLLLSIGPAIPAGDLSESGARLLAGALTHALELLSSTGATDPTEREIAMAARAATSRFLGASQP